jgi:hypothetical protein
MGLTIGLPKVLIDAHQQMVTISGHPRGTSQMARPDPLGARFIPLRFEGQHDAGYFLPVCAFVVCIKQSMAYAASGWLRTALNTVCGTQRRASR